MISATAQRIRQIIVWQRGRTNFDDEVRIARRLWDAVKVRRRRANDHVRNAEAPEGVDNLDRRFIHLHGRSRRRMRSNLTRIRIRDPGLVKFRVLMADAVGHQSARPLEQPWSFQNFLAGLHRSCSRDLFAVKRVNQIRDRHDRSRF